MTTYTNIPNAKFWKKVFYTIAIICFCITVYYWISDAPRNFLYFFCYIIALSPMGFRYLFTSVIVDEEKGLVFLSSNKQFPMPIQDIKSVRIKRSKSGKYRSLIIRDNGVRFINVNLNEKQGMALLEQLKTLNPNFKVSSIDYI